MFKYFLLSLLAYYVYHNIIAPMLRNPSQPNHNQKHSSNYQEENSMRYYRNENKGKSNKKDDDYIDYEEIK